MMQDYVFDDFLILAPFVVAGSRYISGGPDAHTKPEDVPQPPALCVLFVPDLNRPRPWRKSEPQVIFARA